MLLGHGSLKLLSILLLVFAVQLKEEEGVFYKEGLGLNLDFAKPCYKHASSTIVKPGVVSVDVICYGYYVGY